MSFFKDKRKRKIFIIVLSVVLVVTVIFAMCGIYLGDYYKADMQAIQIFLRDEMQWEKDQNGNIAFVPNGATEGFIFYPGGKVEYTAYIPLMQELYKQGVLCVIVEMPFNLAVFDINAADEIQEEYPYIESWYIGGHSLGGSMAASYIANKTEDYDGLVLLGAYSTADLSNSKIDVLSIYGREDEVMNRQKYENNKSNLPQDFTEIVIEGGCHAYFGMYGEQKGDGIPSISNEEQIHITADAIVEKIKGN